MTRDREFFLCRRASKSRSTATFNLSPSACMTFNTVANSGLPSLDNALYRRIFNSSFVPKERWYIVRGNLLKEPSEIAETRPDVNPSDFVQSGLPGVTETHGGQESGNAGHCRTAGGLPIYARSK